MIPPPLEEIQQIAQRIVESEGMELIDLEFKAGKSRNLLRIFIDKNGGVTLDDCENISRQIGTMLDVKDLVKNAYVLEVSSPGVDRPFKTDRDYQRALGRTVKVQYVNEQGQFEQAIGTLSELNGREIFVEEGGQSRIIRRDVIRRANQEILLPVHPKKKKRK